MTPRRATPKDAPALARLNAHVQGWHAARYPDVFYAAPDPAALAEWFAARLAEPATTAFLVDDPPLGYALCQKQTREASVFSPAVCRLLVEQIAVSPEARRMGHGRSLLSAARQLALEIGASEILLDTWEANHAAHAFFRATGFAPRRMLFHATP